MNLAFLKSTSPWHAIFPNGVSVLNPFTPERGVMEGDNGNQPQEFYRVDVKRLTPEQLERVCEMVARQCGGSKFEVRADIDQRGYIPLRAIHVSATATDTRAFL